MTSRPDADPAAPAPVALVAAHGDLAAGLVSAVEQITGRGALLVPLTNRGLGPAEIEVALRAALDAHGIRAVFTDLSGGSCTMAARRLQRERPGLSVATGVNLAALLDFVCAVDGRMARPAGDGAAAEAAADALPADVARAVERGRGALAACAPPPAPARA
jgi:PTS system N-acetylgalactosamine-specific IIA component